MPSTSSRSPWRTGCPRTRPPGTPEGAGRDLARYRGCGEREGVNQVEVNDVVEERDPAEDHEEPHHWAGSPVHQGEQRDRGPKGHEQIQERRRILAGVEERQQGVRRALLD